MKVTVFTKNSLRHAYLVQQISKHANEVFVISESKTCDNSQESENLSIKSNYFKTMHEIEKKMFGHVDSNAKNIKNIEIEFGFLSKIQRPIIEEFLESDVYIVFGSSYIKGWLGEELINKKAINIHMGVSPYYRGASCNFWALFDLKPELVGATIHHLSDDLDTGDMLFHVFPQFIYGDTSSMFAMRAVKKAIDSTVLCIINNEIKIMKSYKQNRRHEIRYSVQRDFADDVITEFKIKREPKLCFDDLEKERETYPHLLI